MCFNCSFLLLYKKTLHPSRYIVGEKGVCAAEVLSADGAVPPSRYAAGEEGVSAGGGWDLAAVHWLGIEGEMCFNCSFFAFV